MSAEIQLLDRAPLNPFPDGLIIAVSQGCTQHNNGKSAINSDRVMKPLKHITDRLKLNFQALNIRKDPSGKPRLNDTDGSIYGFSVSHTSDLWLCGVYLGGELGVDVERTDRRVHERLIQRILHQEEEIETFESVMQLWTIKEAVLKLTGTGLRTNMSNVLISRISEEIFKVNHDKYSVTVVSFESSGHWISVAYSQY